MPWPLYNRPRSADIHLPGAFSREFSARIVDPVGSDMKRVNASMTFTVVATEEGNVEKQNAVTLLGGGGAKALGTPCIRGRSCFWNQGATW